MRRLRWAACIHIITAFRRAGRPASAYTALRCARTGLHKGCRGLADKAAAVIQPALTLIWDTFYGIFTLRRIIYALPLRDDDERASRVSRIHTTAAMMGCALFQASFPLAFDMPLPHNARYRHFAYPMLSRHISFHSAKCCWWDDIMRILHGAQLLRYYI